MRKMKTIKNLLAQKRYFLLFSAVSILSFAALYFLMVQAVYGYSLQIYMEMNGLSYTVAAILTSAAVSILLGIYASLVLLRIDAARKNAKAGAAGIAGIVTSIVGTGCPMCGSFILGLFGAPLGLLFLPLKGLELKAFSIIVLSASIFLMSKNCGTCKVRKQK